MKNVDSFMEAFRKGAADMKAGKVERTEEEIDSIWVKKTYDSKDPALADRIILHKFGSKVVAAFILPLIEDNIDSLPSGVEPVTDEVELSVCERSEKRFSDIPSETATIDQTEGFTEVKEAIKQQLTEKEKNKFRRIDKKVLESENIDIEIPSNW